MSGGKAEPGGCVTPAGFFFRKSPYSPISFRARSNRSLSAICSAWLSSSCTSSAFATVASYPSRWSLPTSARWSATEDRAAVTHEITGSRHHWSRGSMVDKARGVTIGLQRDWEPA